MLELCSTLCALNIKMYIKFLALKEGIFLQLLQLLMRELIFEVKEVVFERERTHS